MDATKLQKFLVSTTLALTALGAAPFATAGLNSAPKHPDGHGAIIGVLKHSEIIGVLKHPDIIGVLKHRDIIGVLKHPDFRLEMRKAGGDAK